jgi:hypothetical protein
MPTRKKVLAKKEVVSGGCPTCGCCCGSGSGAVNSVLSVVFGGLVVALSFFLMQTML